MEKEAIKCTNKSCKKYFEANLDKCPYCGEPVTEKNERIVFDPDEIGKGFWSYLFEFLHLYEKLTPTKAYLLLGGEIILGIVCVLFGWLMSFNSGYRGNSTGALGFVFGGVLIFYSFYAIVKYSTRQVVQKRKPEAKELSIRAIILLVELTIGGAMFFISKPNSEDSEVAIIIMIIGAAMVIISVLSILRYLFNSAVEKRNSEFYSSHKDDM